MIIEDDEVKMQVTIKRLRSGEIHLAKEGTNWSKEDVDKLKRFFSSGKGITFISLALERSESAIYQQIEKLNLYNRRSYSKSLDSSGATAIAGGKCLCKMCTCDPILCPQYNNSCPKLVNQMT